MKLVGITCMADGTPIRRTPRLLKVGIGLSRGPALHCWLQKSEDGKTVQWVFRGGKKEGTKIVWRISPRRIDMLDAEGNSNRVAAEQYYRESLASVDILSYPQKISYFTFTKSSVGKDGKEVFEPDFEAIERHGVMPTSVNILFTSDDPFDGEYAMWTASELKCHGDGVDALRVLSMATEGQKELAARAKEADEKYFPIKGGCATRGCPYYAEQNGKPAACKPNATLKFQLMGDIRIGGTSYFQTTGIRSISWINESLTQIKELLAMMGRDLPGIPLRMSLKPYRTNHNGQPATQYGVWLELRAQDIPTLVKKLDEAGSAFKRIAPATRQIEAPTVGTGAEEDDEPNASAITAEFYPAAMDEEESSGEPETVAEKTEAKTEKLKEELKSETTEPQTKPSGAPSPTDALKEKLKAETPTGSAEKNRPLF